MLDISNCTIIFYVPYVWGPKKFARKLWNVGRP